MTERRDDGEISAALSRERAARQTLMRAQEVGKLGSWEVDLTRNELSWSNMVFHIFEMKREEFGGTEEAFFDLIYPEDRPAFLMARADWLERGGSFMFEHRIVTSSCKVKWVVERAELLRDEQGKPVFMTGTVQDITDLKQAEIAREEVERELSRQAAMIRIAGEIGHIGGWRYAVGSDLVEWTDETARIHDEPPGMHPSVEVGLSYYAPEDRERIKRLFQACMETGARFDDTFRLTTAKGRKVRVRSIGEPEYDDAGLIVAVRGAFQDITDLVDARERLFAAQKMESIGQLTGGIAHDFNNLLAVILGNVELLFDDLNPAEGNPEAEMLSNVVEAAERGAELTRGLLAFARRAPLAPQRLDLNELVRDTQRLAKRTLPATILIDCRLAKDLWPVEVDRASSESALLNLVVNASHAMPGGGTITLATCNVTAEEARIADRQEVLTAERFVKVEVSDTGRGISPANLERIFDPYFTTRGAEGGSGLGLSMVQGFVRQSGGTIRVRSTPGAGATFTLLLPATSAGAVEDQLEEKERTDSRRARALRILLVEDEPGVRTAMEKLMRHRGYTIVSVPSGDAAAVLFQDQPDFDLVLTDIVMPGQLQGHDLIRVLRKTRPDLPAIVISGYASDDDGATEGLWPAVPRLTKPCRRADLIAAIESLVRTDSTLD